MPQDKYTVWRKCNNEMSQDYFQKIWNLVRFIHPSLLNVIGSWFIVQLVATILWKCLQALRHDIFDKQFHLEEAGLASSCMFDQSPSLSLMNLNLEF